MNIPNALARNALPGFIIRPRTFGQMTVSAFQGTFSLFRQENRSRFIELLDKGVIQESVLGQATAGPAMMLSLFNDLQSPLFKRTNFNELEFLEGVGPALERFHNVGGALENQLRSIRDDAGGGIGGIGSAGVANVNTAAKDDGVDPADSKLNAKADTAEDTVTEKAQLDELARKEGEKEDANAGTCKDAKVKSREEKDSMLAAFRTTHSNEMFISKSEGQQAVAVLNTHWADQSKVDPDSLAGQLSKMVTQELFHLTEISAKTSCLLQDPILAATFREESCKVNNVALLSARAKMFVEKPRESDNNPSITKTQKRSTPSYEEIEYIPDDDEHFKNASIAAQLEVLYDVTQEFIVDKTSDQQSSDPATDTSTTDQTTFVGVATMQGWLQGGPDDGELRWKLALHRPAYEFPGIEHAY